MSRQPFLAAIAGAAMVLSAVPAASLPVIPEAVPDRISGIADRVERGALVTTELDPVAPTAKVVDGQIDDWVGTSAMIAGGSHFDAGELIHTDFVWDAHGADAGEDIDRWNQAHGLFYEEQRTERLDDLQRTLDMQLGVPYPIGAEEMYGNANGDLSVGDLHELRIAADADTVTLLVRTGTMINPDDLGILLLADTGDGGSPADPALGLPEDHRFDVVLPVSTGALGAPAGVTVAANADGYTNAVEIAVPADLIAPDGVLDLSVVTGGYDDDGAFVPHNIAFRQAEPIDIYNDRLQAFALHGDAPDGSHLDQFSSGPIDLDDLRGGRTQAVRPGTGYHERQFLSDPAISWERGRDGIRQPYGLFVPSDYDPTVPTPTTFWLHYRGGKAHSGATITPRLIHEHAREDLWRVDGTPAEGTPLDGGQGNLVVTPHARGTSYWYVSQSHQDFFEVFADVHGLMGNIDESRRYLAGYSMGGYGTYLLGLLYPDLFAAGHSVSGAVTQGAWTGIHDSPLCDYTEPFSGDGASPCYIEANSGDASAQLNYRILDNARHFPLHIDHGTNDELVPVTGVQRMAERLIQLGYRVQMQTFPGYEHFSQAAVDEWADGAAYLQRFTAPTNPRHVTYRVVPALVEALNTIRLKRSDGLERFDFNPDGAYWVDDIVVRDADPHDDTVSGVVDVVATGIEDSAVAPVPVSGTVVSPGHSTPYTRHGLDWLTVPDTLPVTTTPGFEGTLTGVAAVTLDMPRMRAALGEDAVVCGQLTTDGPAEVTLAGIGAGAGALIHFGDGSATLTGLHWDGDDVTLSLNQAGEWYFEAGDDADC